MDRKTFFYAADGSLTVIEDGEGHAAAGDDWREAAYALMPNMDRRFLAYAFRPLLLPPEDR